MKSEHDYSGPVSPEELAELRESVLFLHTPTNLSNTKEQKDIDANRSLAMSEVASVKHVHGEKDDVFGLGITALSAASNVPASDLYDYKNYTFNYAKINSKLNFMKEIGYSDELISVIRGMLAEVPSQRSDLNAVLRVVNQPHQIVGTVGVKNLSPSTYNNLDPNGNSEINPAYSPFSDNQPIHHVHNSVPPVQNARPVANNTPAFNNQSNVAAPLYNNTHQNVPPAYNNAHQNVNNANQNLNNAQQNVAQGYNNANQNLNNANQNLNNAQQNFNPNNAQQNFNPTAAQSYLPNAQGNQNFNAPNQAQNLANQAGQGYNQGPVLNNNNNINNRFYS